MCVVSESKILWRLLEETTHDNKIVKRVSFLAYSRVLNKPTGPNKRTGWKLLQKQ